MSVIRRPVKTWEVVEPQPAPTVFDLPTEWVVAVFVVGVLVGLWVML